MLRVPQELGKLGKQDNSADGAGSATWPVLEGGESLGLFARGRDKICESDGEGALSRKGLWDLTTKSDLIGNPWP